MSGAQRRPGIYARGRGAFGGGGAAVASRGTKVADDVLSAGDTGRVSLASRSLTEFPDKIFALPESNPDKWWTVEPVRHIDVSFNAIPALPPAISTLAESLITLKLASNKLRSLPSELALCSHLKQLDVSKNELTALPADLSALGGLVELSVAGNQLRLLPDLSGLRSLEILRAADNVLEELPPSVGACMLLIEVDVSGNARLCELPESLGACTRLRTLLAPRCGLTSLPACLPRLRALTLLDARNNAIAAVPTLPDTASLTEVFLGGNALRRLDGAGLIRRSLAVLDISQNGLAALPDGLRTLARLHTLDVSNNELPVLPAWLGFMPALARLSVEGNPLRTLRRTLIAEGAAGLKPYLKLRAAPEEAAQWEHEYEVMAAGGEVDVISAAGSGALLVPAATAGAVNTASGPTHGPPVGLSGSAAAQHPAPPPQPTPAAAAIAHQEQGAAAFAWTAAVREAMPTGTLSLAPAALPRRLTSFATAQLRSGPLDACPRLRVLRLDGHELAADGLPADLLTACPALEELSLGRNALQAVPHVLTRPGDGRGAQLKVLNLGFNRITSDGVCALPPSLVHLDLRHNELTALPPALGGLASLHTLILAENALRLPDVPGDDVDTPDDDVLWLPALEVLDLSRNALARLPHAVLALPRLHTLDVSYNELNAIPPHVGALPCLTGLALDGNPQRSVRQQLVQRGPAAVLDFLRSRIPEGTHRVFADRYEAKAAAKAAAVARSASAYGPPSATRYSESPYAVRFSAPAQPQWGDQYASHGAYDAGAANLASHHSVPPLQQVAAPPQSAQAPDYYPDPTRYSQPAQAAVHQPSQYRGGPPGTEGGPYPQPAAQYYGGQTQPYAQTYVGYASSHDHGNRAGWDADKPGCVSTASDHFATPSSAPPLSYGGAAASARNRDAQPHPQYYHSSGPPEPAYAAAPAAQQAFDRGEGRPTVAELTAQLQLGGLSSAQQAAVRRQLAMVRAAEARARQQAGPHGGGQGW
jgi:Leucine-rich repeat (LRR) protein